jgi:hypothetical protein
LLTLDIDEKYTNRAHNESLKPTRIKPGFELAKGAIGRVQLGSGLYPCNLL